MNDFATEFTERTMLSVLCALCGWVSILPFNFYATCVYVFSHEGTKTRRRQKEKLRRKTATKLRSDALMYSVAILARSVNKKIVAYHRFVSLQGLLKSLLKTVVVCLLKSRPVPVLYEGEIRKNENWNIRRFI